MYAQHDILSSSGKPVPFVEARGGIREGHIVPLVIVITSRLGCSGSVKSISMFPEIHGLQRDIEKNYWNCYARIPIVAFSA